MSANPPFLDRDLPLEGTIERWAWDYVHASRLDEKLSPGAPPAVFEAAASARRAMSPGRPDEFQVETKAHKQRGLSSPHGRARAMHAFLHHELQAAELFAWALLAFPEAPPTLREGLVRILLDEVRHANLYAEEVRRLGFEVGAFPVRDFFWERVPGCGSIESFLAVMGLGFEAGNLDHAARFAAIFRDVGDSRAAEVQRIVGADEIAHVRFGATWFRALHGSLDFEAWEKALPSPLSPLLMRGEPICLSARRQAGLDESFLEALSAWRPAASSS